MTIRISRWWSERKCGCLSLVICLAEVVIVVDAGVLVHTPSARSLKRKIARRCPSGTHRLEVSGVQSESLRDATSSTDGPVELESIEPTGLAHGRNLCKGSSATTAEFQPLENRFVNRCFTHVRVRHPQGSTPSASEALAGAGGTDRCHRIMIIIRITHHLHVSSKLSGVADIWHCSLDPGNS